MATFELSSEKYKNGRRPFTAILYELQPPECVVDDVGTKFNRNGITFLEEYCAPKLDSIKDMSVTVSFIDEERTQICDHGDTGTAEDGMPVFDDATVVGHFTEGYITDVKINDENKRVVAGKGYIDEMRYHGFVQWLESALANGSSVEGSVEIYKSKGNQAIIYKKGYLPKGRIPTEFIHSGWAMVLCPSDITSSLIELNSQNKTDKEDKTEMDLNMDEIKGVIKQTISETASQTEALTAQISELNTQLADKDKAIAELNEQLSTAQAAVEAANKEAETCSASKADMEAELNTLKKDKALSELNAAIAGYTDDEVKYAESEINSFKENPLEGDIKSIISTICVGMVTKQKEDEAKASELNSRQNKDTVDIFSDMGTGDTADDAEEINIF